MALANVLILQFKNVLNISQSSRHQLYHWLAIVAHFNSYQIEGLSVQLHSNLLIIKIFDMYTKNKYLLYLKLKLFHIHIHSTLNQERFARNPWRQFIKPELQDSSHSHTHTRRCERVFALAIEIDRSFCFWPPQPAAGDWICLMTCLRLSQHSLPLIFALVYVLARE